MNVDESSNDEYSLLFYKQQKISRNQMKNLERKKEQILEKVYKLKAKTHEIHPESTAGCIRDHRRDIQKFISDAKSQKLKKILVPSLIFEGDNFTFEKLYSDWYSSIEALIEKQQLLMKACINQWFNALKVYDLEDDLLEDKTETTDDEVDGPESNSEETTSNFKWFMFLIIFCSVQSLFFYSTEDVKQCTLHPLECVGNVCFKFVLHLYKFYFEFHSINSNFNSSIEIVTEG